MPELGFSLVINRDDYTNKVLSCALECRGMAMQLSDGSYQFLSIMPPCNSLKEFEERIDRLLDQINAARKEARTAYNI